LSACDIQEEESESSAIVVIEPGKDDISGDIHYESDMTIIDLRSKSGIGSVDISYDPGSQSPDLVLRLHLRGLENLRLQAGDTTVEASVSSSHPHETRQSAASENGGSVEMNSTDPLWLNIMIVNNDTSEQVKIPLEDGYFQVAIPQEVFPGEHDSEEDRLLSVSWIDFYR
jgi:hypothetical protein